MFVVKFDKKFSFAGIILVILTVMLGTTRTCPAGIHLKKRINAAINKPVPKNAPVKMELVFVPAPEPPPEAAQPVEEVTAPPLTPAQPPSPGYKTLVQPQQVPTPVDIEPDKPEEPAVEAQIEPAVVPDSPQKTVVSEEIKEKKEAEVVLDTPEVEPEPPAPATVLIKPEKIALPATKSREEAPQPRTDSLEPVVSESSSPEEQVVAAQIEPDVVQDSPQKTVLPESAASRHIKVEKKKISKKTNYFPVILGILFIFLAVFCFLFIGRRKKKNKTVFVMFRDQQQLICSRWNFKDDKISCEKLQTFDWRQDTKSLFQEAFNRAGYQSSMLLVPLLASEQVRTFFFILPRLRKAKIKNAVEEKIREEKIPYNSLDDKLQISLLKENKIDKTITLLVTVFTRQDFEREWPGLRTEPDMVCSITAALTAGLPLRYHGQTTGIIAYRLNEEELIILNMGAGKVSSRRLYSLAGVTSADDPASQWRHYFDHLEQILELYYRRHQQLISTIYLGGKDVPLTVDPHGEIAERLRCNIKRLESGHRSISCQEILQGAARLA